MGTRKGVFLVGERSFVCLSWKPAQWRCGGRLFRHSQPDLSPDRSILECMQCPYSVRSHSKQSANPYAQVIGAVSPGHSSTDVRARAWFGAVPWYAPPNDFVGEKHEGLVCGRVR